MQDQTLEDSITELIDDRRFDEDYKGGLHESNRYVAKIVAPYIQALVKTEVEKAKQELREKFGIDSSKKYDVKIGNGVVVIQEAEKQRLNEREDK